MKNMDDILKSALTPNDEPDFWLNQNILSQAKEVTNMKRMNRRKLATIVCSCILALGIGSISVYAAWKYLRPNEVIEEWANQWEQGLWDLGDLKTAFSEENAIYINETQSYGGYDVTLLGVTSGENLTKYKYKVDGIEKTDLSYILFAIEHEGKPLDDFDDLQFFPVIMGYDYEEYWSLFPLGGRTLDKDGVLYYMYECNNLEKFADHDIYMCVSDDLPELSEYSYIYDNDAGIIARNEEYEGLNALFSLPLDPAKADPKAVEAAIKEREEQRQKTLEEEAKRAKLPLTQTEQNIQKAYAFLEQITPENINDYATPLTDDGAIQTFALDNQGRYHLDIAYSGEHSRQTKEQLFPDGKTASISSTGVTNGNLDTLLLELFTLNDDGTATVQFYKPNFQ